MGPWSRAGAVRRRPSPALAIRVSMSETVIAVGVPCLVQGDVPEAIYVFEQTIKLLRSDQHLLGFRGRAMNPTRWVRPLASAFAAASSRSVRPSVSRADRA